VLVVPPVVAESSAPLSAGWDRWQGPLVAAFWRFVMAFAGRPGGLHWQTARFPVLALLEGVDAP
jgi:hypothetical protein